MEGFSDNIQYYALIFARLLGLFYTAPILNAGTIANSTRVGLALLLSAALYSSSVNFLPALPETPLGFGLAVLSQATVGGIIGFMIFVIFTSFQVVGEVLSLQMGISFSEVLDPQSQISVPLLGTLKNTIGMLLFLAVPFQMDGIYVPAFLHMIRALAISFQSVPALVPDQAILGGIFQYMDHAFGIMFVTALKVGVPLMGILFISSLTLGLLGRAAPQMNLINMGIQVNIIVGLIVLLTLIPVVVPLMADSFVSLYDRMGNFFADWHMATREQGL